MQAVVSKLLIFGRLSWVLTGALFFLMVPLAAQDDGEAGGDYSAAPGEDNGQDVSFQTFYDSLASQGSWVQTDDYGYVWQPSVDDPQWAPYTNGHWVYSDDGWTWVSDEPWGWATYHYGRWVDIDGTGWCWVPGYTWAPAWVSWRYGGGYCGWAPLPPDSLVGVDYSNGDTDYGVGFHIGGDCDSYYGIGAGWYNFLPVVYLGEPDYRGFYSHRRNNSQLLRETTNVTNVNVNRRGGDAREGSFGRVTTGGPSLLQVNARSQSPIQRVDLAFTDRVGGGEVSGNKLSIFAPRINLSTMNGARPVGTIRSLGQVAVNREGNSFRPMTSNGRNGANGEPSRSSSLTEAKRSPVVNSPEQGRRSSISSMRPLGYSRGNERSDTRSEPSRSPAYLGGARSYHGAPGYSRPGPSGGGYRPSGGGVAPHGGGGSPGRQGH